MHEMIKRWMHQRLIGVLNERPAAVLVGARQVGKTTLALSVAQQIESVYIDLQNPRDLLKLRDPLTFFETNRNRLIILDEVQRTPDIFSLIRGVIDRNRRSGRKNRQFLLLGSASMQLLRQTSESLAGRVSYQELYGLNVLEIDFSQTSLNQRWLRGGFPDSILADHDDSSMNWINDLISTYLNRDIPQFAFKIPSDRLWRLWGMLAHLQGETVNHAKLGGNLEIDSKTVSRYIEILTDLLLVRRLAPWFGNTKKRLVKSPRHYVRDSGVLHRLLNISSYDELLSNPILGKSWEGFVIENIQSILPPLAQTYFYRSSTGAEIDLIIRFSIDDIWAIEIKFGVAPKVSKVFSRTCDEVGATAKFVVYGGDDQFPIGDDVTMISLPAMMNRLQQRALGV